MSAPRHRSAIFLCLRLGGLALCLAVLSAAPAKASGPTVVTESATNIGTTSATLNGYVDPTGGPEVFKCYFEYGSDTTYGGGVGCQPEPMPPFTTPTHVSADISGLQSNATYHFRLVAVVEPSGDQFTYGADQSFCTDASCVSKSPTGVAPGNIKPPAISGNVRIGKTVYCSEGAWSGDLPQRYTFTWLRDGSTIVSGPSSLTTYAVRSSDSGHQLSCRVVATNGAGSASATSPPVTVSGDCTPSRPPKAVVVMLMGLNSSLRGSSFNPLAVSACDAASSRNPSLHDLGEVFDSRGLGSSGLTLMTSLAKTGAVILPYSYAGAYFAGDSTAANPRFVVNGYGSHAPNEADIITQDWVLDSELQSIRSQWPSTKLFVIGHSEGGLIAKQWWRNWDGHHSPAPNHATTAWDVDGVFSLDGPINGGSNPFEYLSALGPGCPLVRQLPCVTLAQQFSALWYNFALNGDDTGMARADTGRHGIFTPIGTRGDLIMEVLSMSGKLLNVSGEELGPQLFASFDSDGQINTLIQPGRITPTAASATEGFESHQLVYREPANVRFLTNAVDRSLSARVQRRFRASMASSGRIQVSSAGPSGSLASPVAGPGGTIMVAGSGFGPTPGQVSLIDPDQTVTSLPVSAWSPTIVTAGVPGGATEGLVVVETSDHESFVAGSLTILDEGSTGVAELRILPGPLRAIDNQPIEVRLKAVRSDASPAVGAPVTISDGLQSATQTTNGAGVTKVAISGAGSQVIARSGLAWVGLPLRWSNPAKVRFDLHAGRSRGNRRTVVASVRLRHGGPARGMAVTYRVMRKATGKIVRKGSVRTDRGGRATLSLRIRGALVVTATTNFGFATRQVILPAG